MDARTIAHAHRIAGAWQAAPRLVWRAVGVDRTTATVVRLRVSPVLA